jgi:hypothetical protein
LAAALHFFQYAASLFQQLNTASAKIGSVVSWPNNNRDEKEDATKEP